VGGWPGLTRRRLLPAWPVGVGLVHEVVAHDPAAGEAVLGAPRPLAGGAARPSGPDARELRPDVFAVAGWQPLQPRRVAGLLAGVHGRDDPPGPRQPGLLPADGGHVLDRRQVLDAGGVGPAAGAVASRA
jgi:hypothetical protein